LTPSFVPQLSIAHASLQLRHVHVSRQSTFSPLIFYLSIRSAAKKEDMKKDIFLLLFWSQKLIVMYGTCGILRRITFSYNHKLKVLTTISANMFGLVVYDSTASMLTK
jgi:hypothetical protein